MTNLRPSLLRHLQRLPLRRPATFVAALLLVGAQASVASATAPAAPAAAADSDPFIARSQLGGYMAGRVARAASDVVAASGLYTRALAGDPNNLSIQANAFEMAAVQGDMPRAIRLAGNLVGTENDNRMARVLLALSEYRAGRFEEADKHLVASAGNPVADLTANITRAWMKQAQGDTRAALEHLTEPKAAEPILQFYRYHRALLLDVAGRKADARQAYDAQVKSNRTLRFALAQAHSASHSGDQRGALAALLPQVERARADTHPLVRDAQRRIEAGERLPLLVATPEQGMAEAYYGLGEALTSDGGFGPGAMLLQFALYMHPDMPFALAAMANVYESAKRYDLANGLYQRIARGTALDTPIDLRRALNLNALEQFDAAKALLEEVIQREPTNLVPLDTLGSIYRGRKRHEDAIAAYDRLIALIPKPEARHWTYFYARGTSFERAKKWPQAEADLRTALRLSPEQATVLNYLGYSWVDQGKNLKEGLALIEKAVRLKPDDGYIVDSLGWAHFRLGNFKDAAKWLERAVELRPEDPTLNDHLGDAYWRIGREREARFQWDLALSLKPEPEEVEKIKKKVEAGLPALAQPKAQRSTKQVQGTPQQPKKRTDAQNRPATTNPVQ